MAPVGPVVQQPPGRKTIEDLQIQHALGELGEQVGGRIARVDEEIQQMEANLAKKRVERKLLQAGPEVIQKVEELKQAYRRVIEGQRWIEDSGGRVQKELDRLKAKITQLKDEMDDLQGRFDKLAADKGKTFGTEIQKAGQEKVDQLTPEVVKMFEDKGIELDVDTILESVR